VKAFEYSKEAQEITLKLGAASFDLETLTLELD
jgi:hypothetical protein